MSIDPRSRITSSAEYSRVIPFQREFLSQSRSMSRLRMADVVLLHVRMSTDQAKEWRTGGRLSSTHLYSGFYTELVEGRGQFAGQVGGVAAFDLPALDHLHHFSVAHESDRRRRGAIANEVLARTRCRVTIVSGEDSDHAIRQRVVFHCHGNGGTRHAGCAPAHGVHYDQDRTLLFHRDVDFFRGACFLDTQAGQLLAH